MRPRNPNCAVCGDSPIIDKTLVDYEVFCGSKADDKTLNISVLSVEERLSCDQFAKMEKSNIVLIDVRPSSQFEIFSLESSINIPIDRLKDNLDKCREMAGEDKQCVVVCRRGNDSQLAVQLLKSAGITNVVDIIGGFLQMAKTTEKDMPIF